MSTREAYTRDRMNGVPVDDDVTYTLLGLVVRKGLQANKLSSLAALQQPDW